MQEPNDKYSEKIITSARRNQKIGSFTKLELARRKDSGLCERFWAPSDNQEIRVESTGIFRQAEFELSDEKDEAFWKR